MLKSSGTDACIGPDMPTSLKDYLVEPSQDRSSALQRPGLSPTLEGDFLTSMLDALQIVIVTMSLGGQGNSGS